MVRTVLAIWVGCSLGLFIAGLSWRLLRYALAPVHLRWDLYPVAHEPASRRKHGGSYLEELDWWTRPRHRSLTGEITAMAEEIFLLKAVFKNNRSVWWRALPFHWGLYLLTVTTAAMIVLVAGVAPQPLTFLANTSGLAGGGLLFAGAIGLIGRRITDPGLALYTTRLDLANLGLLAAFGALSAAVALGRQGIGPAVSLFASFTGGRQAAVPPLLQAQIVIGGLFIAYLPFTRMIHCTAKYFTYHRVRWDDTPRIEGTRMAHRLQAALATHVSWAANHVQTGSTWAEVAASMPDTSRKDTH